MISNVILLATFFIVTVLCVQVLKATKGTSILAWHAFFFVLVFDIGALVIEQILNADFPSLVLAFDAFYDRQIANKIVISLILVNVVAVVLLFALKKRVETVPPSSTDDSLYRFFPGTPVFFHLGLLLVAIGIWSYVNTSMGRVILEYGPESLGDYNAYYEVRYEASVAGMTNRETHLHHLAITTTLPLLALYSLQRYILKREKRWLGWWVFITILWTATAVLLFAKSFIINVVLTTTIGIILTLRMRRTGRTLSAFWAIVGAAAVFFIANLVYQFLGATKDPLTSAVLLIERFVAIPITTTWNHFVVFPDLFPHTHYGGSRTLNLLLAGGQTPGSRELLPYQIASAILTSRAYNMNTGFVGSGWAELGFLGVVQAAILIFGCLFLWDLYLQKKRSVVPLAALIAFYLGKIWNIHNGDLVFMLTSGGLLFAPAIYIALFYRELRSGIPLRSRRHRRHSLPAFYGLSPAVSRPGLRPSPPITPPVQEAAND